MNEKNSHSIHTDAVYLAALADLEPKREEPSQLEPAKCSIAVLPFVNMSGDAEQDYFADGIAEDLLIELSRYRHLAVVSRISSFAYKNRTVNVQLAGRELGADFILEGSVRKAGSRIRIAAQLSDCVNGKHVWAERYDRSVEDIFVLQDDIVASILAGLTYNLDDAAARQRGSHPTASSSAYSLFLQGRSLWRLGDEPGARELLQRATELDSNYARAYAYLAFLQAYSLISQESRLSDEDIRAKVLERVLRSIALDKGDPFVQHRAAMAYALVGEWKKSLSLAELAVQQVPRDIEAKLVLGAILVYNGKHQEGIRLIFDAGANEKRWPPGYKSALFDAHYLSRDYIAALDAVTDLVEAPAYIWAYRSAAMAKLGRIDEAHACLREATARKEGFDAARLAKNSAMMCALPEDAENWLDGFRQAGVAAKCE
ncbi:tetratricopeptide repeat protein [Aestuariivirga sp.]|uniref:tetratricopeptide repeat protein n=1 Tax=Aestuariivirga sp. TaxID=2650926 RepID=UPI003918C620